MRIRRIKWKRAVPSFWVASRALQIVDSLQAQP